MSRPVRCGAALVALCARGGVGVLSWCANARARRERGGGGEPRGADRGGLGGGWWWWHVMLASSAHLGGKIGTTGVGAWCAPGRGGGGASSFGCAWWWWGVVLFSWWWRFPSVASGVGGGVGWLVVGFGCGQLGVVVWVGWLVVGCGGCWGLGWLVVGCGGCWGWVFFVLFCLLFFGVFLLLFVCFGVGWWVGGGVVCCVGLSVGAGCCLVGGWCVVGLPCWGLCCLGVGWGCGLGLVVWGSAGCVLVVLGEWHGVWCLLPCCLDVVCAVVGGVSAACAVGVGVWVGCGLVGVGVGAGWWVLVEVCGVCVFFVEFCGGLGGGLGFADL